MYSEIGYKGAVIGINKGNFKKFMANVIMEWYKMEDDYNISYLKLNFLGYRDRIRNKKYVGCVFYTEHSSLHSQNNLVQLDEFINFGYFSFDNNYIYSKNFHHVLTSIVGKNFHADFKNKICYIENNKAIAINTVEKTFGISIPKSEIKHMEFAIPSGVYNKDKLRKKIFKNVIKNITKDTARKDTIQKIYDFLS